MPLPEAALDFGARPNDLRTAAVEDLCMRGSVPSDSLAAQARGLSEKQFSRCYEPQFGRSGSPFDGGGETAVALEVARAEPRLDHLCCGKTLTLGSAVREGHM